MKRTPALVLFFTALACLRLGAAGIEPPLSQSRIVSVALESAYAGRKIPCRIYLPKGYGGGKSFPVLYALNGYGSDESMWIDAGITRSADALIDEGSIPPLIMVFPYTRDATMQEISKDFQEDGRFDERSIDRFICTELVPFIGSHYAAAGPSERYIAGFSMGGAIALRIAFHHPDMFSRAGGYSPAVTSRDYSGMQLEQWLYPNDDMEAVKDVSQFDAEKGLGGLSVYLDAGRSNDPFFEGVQSLYAALQRRGIRSEFHPYDGGHSLDHMHGDFREYLEFYASGR